jgi:nicotinamidase-related amidase
MTVALLALHYQNEVVHPQGRIRLGIAEQGPERASVIAAARRLLGGARACRIPVISVRIAFEPGHAEVRPNAEIWRRVVAGRLVQEGSWGAEFYEGLGPLPDETVVTHTRNNAFYRSSLDEVLRHLATTRLVLAGIATNYSVESTARHASDAGYDTVVIADACAAASPAAHRASLAALELLATIRTTDEILGEWERGA